MNRAQILKYIKNDDLALFDHLDNEFIQTYQDKNKDTLLHLATQKEAKQIIFHLMDNYPELLLKKNNLLANFLTDAWFSLNSLTEELFVKFKTNYPEKLQEYISSSITEINDNKNTFLMRIVSLSEASQFEIFKTYFWSSIENMDTQTKKQYLLHKNEQGKNVAHLVAYYGYEHLIDFVSSLPTEAMLVPQDYLGYTPLFEACEHANIHMMKTIIAHEPQALSTLSIYDSSVLFVAVFSRQLEVVKYLVENTAIDVFHKNANTSDVLGFSLKYGTPDIIDYLFDYFSYHKKIFLDITKPQADILQQLFFNFSKKNAFLLPKIISYIQENAQEYVSQCNTFDYTKTYADPLNQVLRLGTLNDVKAMQKAGFNFIEHHLQYVYAKDYYLASISAKEALEKLDHILTYDTNTSLSLELNAVHSVFKKQTYKNDEGKCVINIHHTQRLSVLYENQKRYMSVNTFGWYLVPHLFNQYSLSKSQSLLKTIEKRKKISIYDLYLSLLVSLYQQKQDKIDFLTQEISQKFSANAYIKSLYEEFTHQSAALATEKEKLQFIHFVLLFSTNIIQTKYLSILNITHFKKDFYDKNQFLVHLCTKFRDKYFNEWDHVPKERLTYHEFNQSYLSIYELDHAQYVMPLNAPNFFKLDYMVTSILEASHEQALYAFDKIYTLLFSYEVKISHTTMFKSHKKKDNPTTYADLPINQFLIKLFNESIRLNKVDFINAIYQKYANGQSFHEFFRLKTKNELIHHAINQYFLLNNDSQTFIEKLNISVVDKSLLAAAIIMSLAQHHSEDAEWAYKKYHLIEAFMSLTNIPSLAQVGMINLKNKLISLGEKKKDNHGDAAFTYAFIPLMKEKAKTEGYVFNYDKFIIRKIAYIKNSLMYYLFDENKEFLQKQNNVKSSIYVVLGNKKRLTHRGKTIKDNVRLQNILLNHLKINTYQDLVIDKTTLINKALIEAEFETANLIFDKVKQANVDFYNENQEFSFEHQLTNLFDISEYSKIDKLLNYVQDSKQFKPFDDPFYMVNQCINQSIEALEYDKQSQFHYSESNVYSLEAHLHLAMKRSANAFNSNNSVRFFIALAKVIEFYIKSDSFYHGTIFNKYLFEVLEFLFSKMDKIALQPLEQYMSYFDTQESKVRQYFEKYLIESLVVNEAQIVKKKMKI